MRKEISDQDFLTEYRLPITEHGVLLRSLEEATRRQDGSAIEDLLFVGEHFGLIDPQYAPVLCELVLARWHSRHEDVARHLQDLRDPRSVEALFHASTVKHDYLAYDDSLGLARKCSRALGDVNTAPSVIRLEELANSEDEAIATLAQRRLVKLRTRG